MTAPLKVLDGVGGDDEPERVGPRELTSSENKEQEAATRHPVYLRVCSGED